MHAPGFTLLPSRSMHHHSSQTDEESLHEQNKRQSGQSHMGICALVRVRVCVHVRMHVHAYMCVCGWGCHDAKWCCVSGPPHASSDHEFRSIVFLLKPTPDRLTQVRAAMTLLAGPNDTRPSAMAALEPAAPGDRVNLAMLFSCSPHSNHTRCPPFVLWLDQCSARVFQQPCKHKKSLFSYTNDFQNAHFNTSLSLHNPR